MEDQSHIEWARLMAAAQRGDRESYARLLREIVPVLARIARQRWSWANAADIEDVVQETLKSVHAARHTYDPRRPFRPWLLAILRYRIADQQRRHARTARLETEMQAHGETLSGVATNTHHESVTDGKALHEAISALPPSQRTAVELVKLKEMSLKEASAASGMSVTALKVATHRALKALRTSLGGGS